MDFTPKMDGKNNGSKPYFVMDDLGVPLFLETPIYCHMKGTYYFNKYDVWYNIDIFDRTSAYHIGKSAPFFHGFLIDVKKNIAGRWWNPLPWNTPRCHVGSSSYRPSNCWSASQQVNLDLCFWPMLFIGGLEKQLNGWFISPTTKISTHDIVVFESFESSYQPHWINMD